MDVTITTVASDEDSHQIKDLQTRNLRRCLSDDEADKEGFLTAEYSLEFLIEMNNKTPAIIAKVGDIVVGYTLVSDREVGAKDELLSGLFHTFDAIEYDGSFLCHKNVVICGQLCIEKAYRGKGLVNRMYQHFKDCYRSKFDYCMTDVSAENPRSVRAHEKAGFKVISENICYEKEFLVVMWDWNK